jgi:hypothetical protein
MKHGTFHFRYSLFSQALTLAFTTVALAVSSYAQAPPGVLDGFTPTALTPGSPTGSYALSGFETVNPLNGALNINLPLLRIGGRGTAGYTIQLPFEQKWHVVHSEKAANAFVKTYVTTNGNYEKAAAAASKVISDSVKKHPDNQFDQVMVDKRN